MKIKQKSLKMAANILHVKQPVLRIDDVTSQQYHTYTPYTTTYKNNDEIRITIQSQDLYILPSESYLQIEFTTARNDGQLDATFTYGFISHMFSEIRYELNGVEIDRTKSPGITSLLKCMTACKTTDKLAHDLYVLNSLTNVETKTYQATIPLRLVLGFCDDFNKIILNSKHELVLARSRSDINVFQTIDNIVQLNVTKIHWKVPHVVLSDTAKLSMLRTVARNDHLPLAFRSWDLYELPALPQSTRHMWNVKTTTHLTKPRYVIVAFQSGRDQIENANASYSDHCDTTNVKLHLNNERFPYDDMNLKFRDFGYNELYHAFSKIQHSYYNSSSPLNPINVTFTDFMLRPVFAFDCSRSDETIKSGMVDVCIEIESSKNFPYGTKGICLIIHDNLIKYSPFSSLVHREI